MEFDQNNQPGYEPPKAGRNWFACCGIGCVVLFLLCGLGAVFTYFFAGEQIKLYYDHAVLHVETMQIAIESEVVRGKLGAPVQPEGFSLPEVENLDGNIQRQKYDIKLKGSNATGNVHVEYLLQPGQPVKRSVFNLEVDGEIINLLDEPLGFELDIDEGGNDLDLNGNEFDMDGDLDLDDENSLELESEYELDPVGAGSDDQ